MMTNEAHLLAVAAVFTLAGGVKGVTGMGLPTVAVSLLGLWMSPAQAAALLVMPSLATNIAQCRGPALRRLVAMLWPAWLAMAVVTVAMPEVGGAGSALHPQRLLGGVLVAYGAWGLWRPAMPPLAPSRWRAVAAGAATGVVTSMTAVFAIPLVPWLQTLRLGKDEMVQALGLSFTVATLALAVRLQTSHAGTAWLSVPTAVGLFAAFAGLWLGGVVRGRISASVFQRSLFVVFIGLGVANLLHR
jgi:uncharacterized membrane protein YfcA